MDNIFHNSILSEILVWSIYTINSYSDIECAKFRESLEIAGLVGLVPSCHFAFVGISWVRNLSRGYFVGPEFFLVSISWVQFFFRVANFLIQRFSVVGYMRKSDGKQKYRNAFKTRYSTANRFQ